ncbi:Mitochondrial carnitine carrier [Thalictrum thalictroides]|uniref:Mitochondrial carnitine carrier n=1 Tax=Thalictrum thalictroides TaxID=46969 RepID=A0A7J6UXI3_THATH|nr:Mitochondrial carnitine carrier [Thalictrum thalictroides]
MAGRSKASRREQPSIKFRCVSCDDLFDTQQEGDIPIVSDSNKKSSKHSEPESPDILTTAQLVSAIAKVWDYANQPLPFFQPKPNVENNVSFRQNENVPWCVSVEGNNKISISDFKEFRIDPKCATRYYDSVNSSFECVDITQKTSLNKRYVQFDDYYRSVHSWKVNGIASLSFDFGKRCGMVNEISSFEQKYPVHITQIECKKPAEIRSKTTPANILAVECNDCRASVTEVSPLGTRAELPLSIEKSVASLDSDNSLKPVTDIKVADASVRSSEYHNGLDLDNCASGKDKEPLENDNNCKTNEHAFEDVPSKELCSVTRDKSKYVLPNKRHGLAGALSGTFVSLCLHPVDTIKTVTQSHSMAEKSIFHVVRSIISDRGVTGLYRGVASNIASSAPISALYIYSYESIKGALLPLLPKEYHSLVHCIAGGCASIATSFIFTPSERIKQQMQIGSHYQNCWQALVGILGKGGFSSLYAGWGAVLCRNVPHSIIKFYTYETLKQLVMSSTQDNARPSTYQTLLCGGIAGSTAALFTTPFDVVKTRLQTQIPGSLKIYDGVFHALREISQQEGLKGLYRGLTPRLVMYISQGALFFASYEFFKSIFALQSPQICTPALEDKQKIKEGSTSSTASIPAPKLPRLSRLQSELEST